MAGCSTRVVRICFLSGLDSIAARMAVPSLSVPQLVKTISLFETGDTSQYGEGSGGTGATYSGGEVDLSDTGETRSITDND